MKYMIIADVHGNFSELKKHIDIFKNDKYDCLIINGDLCADYSMINLLETLGTKLKITRGNCDYCNQVGTFPVVEIVPLKLNNRNIYITHGQRGIPVLEYQKGDIVCLAHTHMGYIEKYHDLIICNSGSISLPRGGTKSSYLEINDKEIILFQSNGKIIQKYILE